jgi:proteasome lid subunit RPN8/RPN11
MVIFTNGVFELIKAHALKDKPKESCGILAGAPTEKTTVTDATPCTNVDSNPFAAYTIDPTELLRAIDEIEGKGELKHLGFYHSHPFSSPIPSMVDQKRATWDGFLYAIYSVEEDEIRCWRWIEDEGEFVKEKVRIL